MLTFFSSFPHVLCTWLGTAHRADSTHRLPSIVCEFTFPSCDAHAALSAACALSLADILCVCVQVVSDSPIAFLLQ